MVKPDWLSWTVVPQAREGHVLDDVGWAGSFNASFERYGVQAEYKATPANRRPYNRKFKLVGDMGHLFFNPKLDYGTVELTGRGCSMLSNKDEFEMVAEKAAHSVTRFDVAIDFDDETTPFDFVASGVSRRFRTRQFLQSDDGETVYIGSPNSDLHCRVYKYNEPHERAGLLRVEFVSHRDQAKQAIELWLNAGPIAAVAFMASPFDFKHRLWATGKWHGAIVDRKVSRVRASNKTRLWLIKQVRPALLKLAAKDELDGPFLSNLLKGIPYVSVTYEQGDQVVTDTRLRPLEEPDTDIPWDTLI